MFTESFQLVNPFASPEAHFIAGIILAVGAFIASYFYGIDKDADTPQETIVRNSRRGCLGMIFGPILAYILGLWMVALLVGYVIYAVGLGLLQMARIAITGK